MNPTKVGIIGYGMMGQMHAKVWSGINGVTLAALAEPDQARRDAFHATYPACPVFPDPEEMFANGRKLDIAVIATHAPYHLSHVLLALGHGCHVICEKPMALSLQECDLMIAEANRQNRKLAVNHQSIFSSAVMVAAQKIRAGDIGDLYGVKAYGKGRIACSDLMEIAGHLLHLVWYFAGGEVTEVFGDVRYKGQPVTIRDAVRVQNLYPEGRNSGIGAGDRIFGYYKFANGVRGELHLEELNGAPSTFGESRNFGYFIELCGTAGRMQLYLPRVLFFNPSPYDDLSKAATPWIEVDLCLREDVDSVLITCLSSDFLAAIAMDRDPLVSGSVGRIAMEMSLGVYASHLAGKPLTLPLAKRMHPFFA